MKKIILCLSLLFSMGCEEVSNEADFDVEEGSTSTTGICEEEIDPRVLNPLCTFQCNNSCPKGQHCRWSMITHGCRCMVIYKPKPKPQN